MVLVRSAGLAVAAFVVALLSPPVHGFRAADEITSLPGWDGADLPSKWYSGYLDGGRKDGHSLHYHYIFILSENAPATDPGKLDHG